ncbi:hypothetical protein AB3N60_09875 [Leptospira sp. WS39.C2]
MDLILRKNSIQYVFYLIFILGLQFYLSAKDSFISDSLAKAFQIETVKSSSHTIHYPAKSIDPEFNYHPVTFLIKNKGELKSVFSETFAFLYGKIFYFFPTKTMIYFNGIFLLLSIFILNTFGKIKVQISAIVFSTSVILTQVIDLSEVPITILLGSISYTIWAKAILEENLLYFSLSVFLSICLSFFRLEFLILSCLIYSLSIPLIYKMKQKKGIMIFSFFFLIPILYFLFWNYKEYGHPFGIRYLYNFTADHYFAKENRFYNLIKILFTGLPEKGFKFGLFFISPYFVYVLIKYRSFLFSFKQLQPLHYHLTVFIVYPIMIAISAPNDGITITARYALFTMIPGIFIISQFWEKLKKDKVFISFIVFSIFVNLLILKVSKESFKMIRKINQLYENFNADLWVFYDQNISETAGLKLVNQPSISFGNFSDPIRTTNLFKRMEDNKIKSIYIFDFSKVVPNAYMNLKREVELNSDNFFKLFRNNKYTCGAYTEVQFIGYRKCDLNL